MAVISRLTLCVSKTLTRQIFANTANLKIQNKIVFNMAARSLSTFEMTKNMSLISGNKIDSTINDLKLFPQQEKPLVVLLSWLLSKSKHIEKYAELYTERGYDVLTVSISPWQLLWPTKGTQIVARDLLKFIDSNFKYSPLLLHGFSVGAYLWGEVLVKIVTDMPRYESLVNRVIGQIWDSAADITEIPIGFPIAVFPNNKVMQTTLRQYTLYHMKTFDKVATCHYLRSSQMFHTNIIKSPALFLLSKTDPIGSEVSNNRVRESWESMGMKVYWKCWDRSPHVGHFIKHREEYVAEVNQFLENITMGSRAEQKAVKAKL